MSGENIVSLSICTSRSIFLSPSLFIFLFSFCKHSFLAEEKNSKLTMCYTPPPFCRRVEGKKLGKNRNVYKYCQWKFYHWVSLSPYIFKFQLPLLKPYPPTPWRLFLKFKILKNFQIIICFVLQKIYTKTQLFHNFQLENLEQSIFCAIV